MSALRFSLTFAAGLLMAAPAVVTAQTQTPPPEQTQTPKLQPPEAATPDETKAMQGMKSEQRFMVEAYMGNLAEVAFGQLAQQRGQSKGVKDFGQKLIDDHAKANEAAGNYLDQQQVQRPIHVPEAALKTFTKLSEASDRDFDRLFAKELTKEHEMDVAKYQKWSKRAQSAEVKDYIDKTLPVLKEHHKMAKDLQKGAPGKA